MANMEQYNKEKQELICRADRLAYPIRDGIPIMWVDRARSIDPYPEEKPVMTGDEK